MSAAHPSHDLVLLLRPVTSDTEETGVAFLPLSQCYLFGPPFFIQKMGIIIIVPSFHPALGVGWYNPGNVFPREHIAHSINVNSYFWGTWLLTVADKEVHHWVSPSRTGWGANGLPLLAPSEDPSASVSSPTLLGEVPDNHWSCLSPWASFRGQPLWVAWVPSALYCNEFPHPVLCPLFSVHRCHSSTDLLILSS